MHQPMYQDAVGGKFLLPWVRLHAIKGYYDMPSILSKHPKARACFNITPSLLIQMEEYFKEDIREKDEYLRLSLKPADKLEPYEKEFILVNFFMNNWDRVIKPHPRYSELLRLRGEIYKVTEISQIAERFSAQDMIDLQVLFNLCWFGFTLRKKDPKLRALVKKGRHYSEDDKVEVISVQLSAMREMLDLYKRLSDKKQIELTTTPCYHPILPLLYNGGDGEGFDWREDAQTHLVKGLELFEKTFSIRPQGLWPSEGSVSGPVAELASSVGFRWMATDEEILFHSLSTHSAREKTLYAPYEFERNEKKITIFFRDKKLSDLIGFSYSGSDPDLAVTDFINRLRRIYEETKDQEDSPIVSVVLDGENAWEYYRNDGESFLNKLYDRLSSEAWLEMVCFGDFNEQGAHKRRLENLFTGSWINHNFQIWNGHFEDKKAWDYLQRTREFLIHENLSPEQKALAWEELYIAEGSDWFWWYGDEFSSHTQNMFDFLFRNHLMNIYRIAEKRIPSYLQKPIKQINVRNDYIEEPTALITPKIDGRVTGFYEWAGSGRFRSVEPAGAMKKGEKWIQDIYYGADQENLYLRIDFGSEVLKGDLDGVRCHVDISTIDDYILEVELESGDISFAKLLINEKEELDFYATWVSFDSILEIMIPFNSINAPVRNSIELKVGVFKNDIKLEEVPQFGLLTVARPDPQLEKSFWSL